MDKDKNPEKPAGEKLPSTPSNPGKMPTTDEAIIKEIEGKLDHDYQPDTERDEAVADMIRKGDRE